MAIGGLISNRNFGSLIGSGKVCPIERAVSRHRGERSGIASAQYAQGSIFYENGLSSGFSYSSFLQVAGHLDESILKPLATYPLQRRGRCKCYLSADPSLGRWLQSNKGQHQHYNDVKANGIRTYYKSEEYDMIEAAAVDSLKSTEGEAVLASPWWEQFPKRWVIVILCFTAFLLCNMDRVNMSIAILPMSREFNWNSAKVGLIQSSFFGGYLLTQIVGGIWADKIGGKLVLGFGVVWWSIATVSTPIAAKIGLPFLLIMHAFMGIGEGVAMPAMNNILSKWIPVSERSRSLALVYSGMYLGSVTGLAISPIPIHKFGWPSVFYSFGSLGSLSITAVRKIMQSIGFLGPAFFLTQLSHVRTPAMAVLCMACSQGSYAFSQSGLYSNHQDIGPRYAGVLLGLSNTAGVLAGVFGTAATGYILQRGSWADVFKVAVALYIIGTLVWNFFSTGEKLLD